MRWGVSIDVVEKYTKGVVITVGGYGKITYRIQFIRGAVKK